MSLIRKTIKRMLKQKKLTIHNITVIIQPMWKKRYKIYCRN